MKPTIQLELDFRNHARFEPGQGFRHHGKIVQVATVSDRGVPTFQTLNGDPVQLQSNVVVRAPAYDKLGAEK